jgi:hypothetical protein
LTMRRLLPVLPNNRTFSVSLGMSQKSQQQTHAPQEAYP